MADVKWIKITTDIFDDEKILLIESLPDANSIIVVWFKLLCLAGKQNNNGVFLMGRIAYTEQMLATIFRMKESTVQLALRTFEEFGMVEIIDGVITIPNWGKHQTLDAYEKKKVRDRERVARKRAEQKALIALSPDKSPDKSPVVAFSDKEEEKDKESEGDIRDIMHNGDAVDASPKPVKHKYGEYNNVLLTDDELSKLRNEYGDFADRIERLSSYIASTGKKYKSHYATIRNWARKDAETAPQRTGQRQQIPDAIKNRVSDVDNW